MMKKILVILLTGFAIQASAQTNLITNIAARNAVSLNGTWQYIVDPYETGFYDYRYKELKETNKDAYWNTDVPANKTEKKEHGYNDQYTLQVPGDWSHQKPEFVYYEGTIWYKKSFDSDAVNSGNRFFLYFGAVNYRADVYLNGKKLGMHIGGFTPFNFEVPASLLKAKDNFLVVKVDNKRYADEVPTLNTDWWNYGGITRDVKLVQVPQSYIQDYFIQLKKPEKGKAPAGTPPVQGWVKVSNAKAGDNITISIPELKFKKQFAVTGELTALHFKLPKTQLWSPENPKLYTVNIVTSSDKVNDKIGFRTIEASGKQVLLNGKPIFMRGICIHGELPAEVRRAYGPADAKILLSQAKELECNMVRLAHYPHDEAMTRMTDSLGILVWSEIPFTGRSILEARMCSTKQKRN
jgi:beta-glucuronidase